ncbi:MAG: type I-C CRISPR-associated protein Cas8c/Csd1, partial [Nitrospira sp.]|nr:type I-C CRISPR-associated protein Cas8c/Csd1 [Nitrospira sp.]
MILQALAKYYERIPSAAEEGFQQQDISFIITLNKNGDFIGLQDIREGEGKKKKGQPRLVPKSIKRTIKPAANLLWDNPSYVLGRPKPDKKREMKELLEKAK